MTNWQKNVVTTVFRVIETIASALLALFASGSLSG